MRGRRVAPVPVGVQRHCHRGAGDHAASKDIEDFIIIVDGRKELESEIASAVEVRAFLMQSSRHETSISWLKPDNHAIMT